MLQLISLTATSPNTASFITANVTALLKRVFLMSHHCRGTLQANLTPQLARKYLGSSLWPRRLVGPGLTEQLRTNTQTKLLTAPQPQLSVRLLVCLSAVCLDLCPDVDYHVSFMPFLFPLSFFLLSSFFLCRRAHRSLSITSVCVCALMDGCLFAL